MTVPDVAAPIYAYRVWIVGGFSLHSVAFTTRRWSTDGETAMCRRPASKKQGACTCAYVQLLLQGHEIDGCRGFAPCPGCACGLYGWRTLEQAIGYSIITSKAYPRFMVGQIELTGYIEEHHLGYRAQYARISSLYRSRMTGLHLHPESQERVAAHYRVPLIEFPSLRSTE